jgi:hypothetical protein
MLLAILSIGSEEELGDSDSDSDGEDKTDGDAEVQMRTARMLGLSRYAEVARRRRVIKIKILAVGHMLLLFRRVRYAASLDGLWDYGACLSYPDP